MAVNRGANVGHYSYMYLSNDVLLYGVTTMWRFIVVCLSVSNLLYTRMYSGGPTDYVMMCNRLMGRFVRPKHAYFHFTYVHVCLCTCICNDKLIHIHVYDPIQ